MERFHVKILQLRKRLGVKEIDAPSILEAEAVLIAMLYDHFEISRENEKKLFYIVKEEEWRKFKLLIGDRSFSIEIKGK